MSAPKDFQAVLSRWCAQRVPEQARDTRQIGYSMHGDRITIVERRPPTYPELHLAWSRTRITQLRYNDPEKGLWQIYVPAGSRWKQYDHPPSDALESLLAEVAADPASVFWG